MASALIRRTPMLRELDQLSRERPLTPEEVSRLQSALRRCSEPKGQKPWTEGDIDRLRRLLIRGKRPPRIAVLVGRTERAIWRMIYKQGWTVTEMRQVGDDAAL